MKRYQYRQSSKYRKRNLIVGLSIFIILFFFFVPGPNGLYKVVTKSYKIHRLQKEIENLKIKAELVESKIAKGNNPEYLRKYLIDYYKMVPKDSVK